VESATGPATVVLHPEHGKADLEVLCRLRPDDGQTGSCGAVESAPIYFLYLDLWHSSWLLERKNECGNPTLYADNGFFSSSFHGFFPSKTSARLVLTVLPTLYQTIKRRLEDVYQARRSTKPSSNVT
jgi:hypothetical protein